MRSLLMAGSEYAVAVSVQLIRLHQTRCEARVLRGMPYELVSMLLLIRYLERPPKGEVNCS